MKKINPFRPGKPVTPGMFAGREAEVDAIERILSQGKHGNAEHFIITGERGIGKSSLLFLTCALAKGDLSLEGDRFAFLTVSVTLTPTDSCAKIIAKIARELEHKAAKYDLVRDALKSVWQFAQRLEVGGTRIHAVASPKPADMIDDLVNALSHTSEQIVGKADGIIVLIDEADSAASELGVLLKGTVDGLSREGCENICFGLAGLPEIVDRLGEGHASAPRIFSVFVLEPLEPDERKQVVFRGLDAAKSQSGIEVTVTEEALEFVSDLSDGYPHFIQQYAYSAFDTDTDNCIDIGDVTYGAMKEGGALEQLGTRLFKVQYFRQIRTDKYRTVLQVMADRMDAWVSKAELRKATGLKETTLGNALHSLTDKRIILRNPEKQGEYRLPTKSFAIWIKGFQETAEVQTNGGRTRARANGDAASPSLI